MKSDYIYIGIIVLTIATACVMCIDKTAIRIFEYPNIFEMTAYMAYLI